MHILKGDNLAYLKDDLIFERLKDDYTYVESRGYDIFGVFLFGSQNYSADYEDSDIDTRVVVFPKFSEIVNGASPISTIKIKDTGEHIDIKDFRAYIDQLLKPSVGYLEDLCTKYRIVNPIYNDIMLSLSNLCDDIASQNRLKIMLDIWGRKNSHEQHLKAGNKSRIESYGYDYKQVYNLVRLSEFIERFSNGESFTSCLLYSNPDYLIELKRNPPPCNEALDIAKNAVSLIDRVYLCNFDKLKLVRNDNTASDALCDLRIEALKRYLSAVTK